MLGEFAAGGGGGKGIPGSDSNYTSSNCKPRKNIKSRMNVPPNLQIYRLL